MTDHYKSTQDQINKEIGSMFNQMRDPELQEQKALIDNHKKNVNRTINRYGLS